MRLTPGSIVLTVSGGSSLEEEKTVNSLGYLSFSLSREKTVGSSSVLEFCGVSLARDERLVLKDVSWKVKSGEHWAVIGNSGSGKTSMLMMAAGYLWPTSGRVSVLGSRLGSIDLRYLRKHIGWVSSNLRDKIPSEDSALDTVLSGRLASLGLWEPYGKSDLDRARGILDFLGCRELENTSFGVLSQGEQQRVLIARALMPDPNLLILDEPCAGLDLPSRENFIEMLQTIGQANDGPTMILVTHHIEEIGSVFSNVLVLKSGGVLAQGPKDSVLREEVLSEAFEVPLLVTKVNNRFWAHII